MLPDVDTDNGHMSEEGILVSGSDDFEALGLGAQPLRSRYICQSESGRCKRAA